MLADQEIPKQHSFSISLITFDVSTLAGHHESRSDSKIFYSLETIWECIYFTFSIAIPGKNEKYQNIQQTSGISKRYPENHSF